MTPVGIRHLTRRAAAAVLAGTALMVLGAACSKEIPGTPVAVPGEAGKTEAPVDLLSTTCREYLRMDDATRLEVIEAIGEDGNQLVAMNPDLWVGVAGALCTFVDPSAPVRDVVIGQGPR